MFDPSTLTSAISGLTTRDKVGTLLTGIVGQLRDLPMFTEASLYLAKLEREIPALQDTFESTISLDPEPEPEPQPKSKKGAE